MEYIRNTGGNPKIVWFDEDHEPIGHLLRKELLDEGIIMEENGYIKIIDEAE